MSVKRTSDAFISGRDKSGTLPPERSIASYLASQPEVVFPDVKLAGSGRNTNSVFIFSSNRSVQEALAAVLTHTLRCTKIRVVTNLAEVQAGLASALPDLVIIDGNTRHSLAAAMLLKHSGPDSRVVVFGVKDPVSPEQACSQAKIGTCLDIGSSLNGLTASSIDRTDLEQVEGAFSGSSPRSGECLSQNANSAISLLTAREDEVACLIMSGESNKDIARSLNISVATVKSHVHNLLGKLGLKRRGQLGRWYEAQLFAQPRQMPSRPNAIIVPAEADNECRLPLR